MAVVITVNGTPVHLDFDTILIWILVGLVAGFLASHVALGRGLGLFGDTIVGILGAFIGGFLAALFHVGFAIVGHPLITQMVIAFVGAALLLLVVGMFGGGRSRRRAVG
ncbi:MAG TPA: GlsB/YeaQ/YmgE family stress response membrane protein [Candidatus Limnocylindria bacterium]|jgi:uncharacterized membrane protein YeaQ/YmgE (transglycosylase-associated protein family)|nr:GlsB/YeaQ/YmgE family stress response membrane protein [Candidatus Limnocylindria bacterium]